LAEYSLETVDDKKKHRYGIDLYNHGYYWEAHEAWEALWHAYGRDVPEGRLLHGLIALAAAGVKAREGNRRGVVRHARRAAAIFRDLLAVKPVALEVAVAVLAALAENIVADPPSCPAEQGAPPKVVFPEPLMPTPSTR